MAVSLNFKRKTCLKLNERYGKASVKGNGCHRKAIRITLLLGVNSAFHCCHCITKIGRQTAFAYDSLIFKFGTLPGKDYTSHYEK